jgi:hypothetical protein
MIECKVYGLYGRTLCFTIREKGRCVYIIQFEVFLVSSGVKGDEQPRDYQQQTVIVVTCTSPCQATNESLSTVRKPA